MKVFLYLLRDIYAILGLVISGLAFITVPLLLAVEVNPWWAVTEIVGIPVGFSLVVLGLSLPNKL